MFSFIVKLRLLVVMLYKVEYVNSAGQIVSEVIKDQTNLVSFVNTLDALDCNIINIMVVGPKGKVRTL